MIIVSRFESPEMEELAPDSGRFGMDYRSTLLLHIVPCFFPFIELYT